MKELLNEFIRMESMYLWRISSYTHPNNLHLLLTVSITRSCDLSQNISCSQGSKCPSLPGLTHWVNPGLLGLGFKPNFGKVGNAGE